MCNKKKKKAMYVLMRRLIFLTLVVAIFSCSIISDVSAVLPIDGEWRWHKSVGGFTGEVVTPDSAGVPDRRIVFTLNNSFIFYRADTLYRFGHYSLSKRDDLFFISFQAAEAFLVDQQIQFEGPDTLVLIDECTDCYTHWYVRRQEGD
jgi:hypothetical protein